MGLAGYFDVVVTSSEAGAAKPDPAVFLEALMRAGSPPENAAMVADRPGNDIVPASRLGMRAVRLRRGGGPAADREIASLWELPAPF